MVNRFGRRAVSAAVAMIFAASLTAGGPLVTHHSTTAKAATPRHKSIPVHSNGKSVVRNLRRASASSRHNVMPRLGMNAVNPVGRDRSQTPAFRATPAPQVSTAAGPPFAVQAAFPGLSQADDTSVFGGAIEPPDPWVAVGSNAVVQSVNSLVRITDRSGVLQQQVTVDSFFGVLPNQDNVSDPRIIYDAEHDRWVGVILSFDCADGYLYLAISQTNDPLGEWTKWYFTYTGAVPDYPGLGSSSDKIVMSVNEYEIDSSAPDCVSGSAPTSSLLVVDWAEAIGSGFTDDAYFSEPGYFSWRPAPNLSPDDGVYVVGERMFDGDVTYATITGDVANANAPGLDETPVDLSPLTDLSDIPPFNLPPAPRQPGSPPTITQAVDHRPTDAIWNEGSLWFVSTAPISMTGDTTVRAGVRITQVLTSGSPTVRQDFHIGSVGYDTFMGGVGIAADGKAYFVYSKSSPTAKVSTWANVQRPSDSPNTGSDAVLLASGSGTYQGSRWGDYVGVARDPMAPDAVWVADEIPTASGTWTTSVTQLTVVDSVPPTVSIGGPTIVRPSTMTSTAIQSTFATTTTDNATGIASREFERSLDSSAFVSVPSATSYLAIGHRYQFGFRATDEAGNVSSWVLGPSFAVGATDEARAAISYRGTWRRVTSSGAYGGRVKYATSRTASASYRFTGRAIAWVAPTSRSSGSAKVYVDSVYRGTVSLFSSGFHPRRVIFTRAWAGVGTHTIKVVPVGTRGHPRVDIDAFVVLR